MSNVEPISERGTIVVDELFSYPPALIWKALTSGELMARWLMPPSGFEAVEGCRFTMQTKPAGPWDGIIHCEVLDVRPCERFSYSWKGGHAQNVGYGSELDTVVTWTMIEESLGTRLRLVHSGFELTRNDTAWRSMGEGWKKVVPRLGTTIDEQRQSTEGQAA